MSYDIEKFDPPPDPDLVCCICQCVLDRAVECPCRHVFCQSCIERWLTNRHTCPTCRKKTRKQDLRPVLPLVQNMLNRLLMICDYRDNGCIEKVMLEHFERHLKNCGYEKKTCRYSKCGASILRMHLESHESEQCVHRESPCGGDCGLMIPLSDRPTHNCVTALKAHIDEKNRMIEQLKLKLHELNTLSQSLNDQLVELRQQLNDRNLDISSVSSDDDDTSDSDITDFLSGDLSGDSFRDAWFDSTASNASIDNRDNQVSNESSNQDTVNRGTNEGSDVVEQVERTVVNSLFELSSRLERVRNQMRAVLNSQMVQDHNNLNDEVIPATALAAITTTGSTNDTCPSDIMASTSNHNTQNNQAENSGDDNEEERNFAEAHYYSDDNAASRGNMSNDTDEYQNYDVLDETTRESDTNVVSDVSDLNWISDLDSNHTPYRSSASPSMDYDNNARDSFTSDTDQRGRYSSEHVIVSTPPDSPSNTTGSFSSIPSSSSAPGSPASPRNASDTARSQSDSHASPASKNFYTDFSSSHSGCSTPVSRGGSASPSRSDSSVSALSDSTAQFSVTCSPPSQKSISNNSSHGSHSQNVSGSSDCDTCGKMNCSFDKLSSWSSSSESSDSESSSAPTDASHHSSTHLVTLSPFSQDKNYDQQLGNSSRSFVGSFEKNDFDNNISAIRPSWSPHSDQSERKDYLTPGLDENEHTGVSYSADHCNSRAYHYYDGYISEAEAANVVLSDADNVDDKKPLVSNQYENKDTNESKYGTRPKFDEDVPQNKDSPVFHCEPDSTQNIASQVNGNELPANDDVDEQDTGAEVSVDRSVFISDSDHSKDSDYVQYSTKRLGSAKDGRRSAKMERYEVKVTGASGIGDSGRFASSSVDSGIFTETYSANSDMRSKKNSEKKRKLDHNELSHENDVKRRRVHDISHSGNVSDSVENENGETPNGSKQSLKYDFRRRHYDSCYPPYGDTRRTVYTSGEVLKPGEGMLNPSRSRSSPLHYNRSHSQEYIPSYRRSRTGNKTNNINENNGQSLNVKIDLSLINYSGHIGNESSSSAIPTATVVGSTSLTPVNYSSSSFRKEASQTRQYHNDNSQKSSSPKPDESSRRSTYRHHTLRSHRRDMQAAARTSNSASPVRATSKTASNQDYESSWLEHVSDESTSDDTWEPGSGCDDMDDTFSECEDDIESDSSYEVLVPKSTAALLEEYASDESDESWTVDMG